MNNNKWSLAAAAASSSSSGEPSNNNNNMVDGSYWQTELQADSRQRIVNRILDSLKRHLPITGPEGLVELQKIAVRFEEKIYTAATSQSDYLRKISLKMLLMETKSPNTGVANSIPQNPVASNQNPLYPANYVIMDGSASMLSSNKKILLDRQNNGIDQDRISSLPASVLHHILSFLPTKYAVGTSILSTKWKYLWISVSNLDFSDELLYSTRKSTKKNPMLATTFKNFVNRVLLLHDGLTLDNFILSCTAAYDDIHVNMWITTLLKRKVQRLILSIPLKRAFVFPRCLFHCESLTALKIDLHEVCYFRVPTTTCFPNLKSLHLESVTFCAAEHSVQEVFFSFPVLEYMCVYKFRININIINISAPLLTELTMDDHENESVQECKVVVYAETLRFLELKSDLSCKYSLHNLSSLYEAIIDVYCSTTTIVDRVIKLLGSICNVKDLKLSERTIDSLFYTEDTLAHLPTFFSLVNVTVTADPGAIDANNLMSLLHKMPCIECLRFCAPYTFDNYDDTIPQCILSHLKLVQLDDFLGSEPQLCLVKVLLTNARLMEKITIRSSVELAADSNKQLEVAKQLLMMIPRASANCVTDFA